MISIVGISKNLSSHGVRDRDQSTVSLVVLSETAVADFNNEGMHILVQ
jgi:hypothetical protein